MNAQDVLELYTLLGTHSVRLWLDGGWGIDALLGRQTRPHKDLDAFVAFADLPTLARVLSQQGFGLKQIWEENQWLRHAADVPLIGNPTTEDEVATAFVLQDGRGRELDCHVLHIAKDGDPTPAWMGSLAFAADALSGQGNIAGVPVQCLSVAMHMRTHTGYELQAKDRQDLRHLHEQLGIAYPAELAHLGINPAK